MSLVVVMIISLVLTIIIEEIFAFFVGNRTKRDLILVLLVNVITNPMVVYLYHAINHYFNADMRVVTVGLETAAILIEGTYYESYGRSIRYPYWLAIGANIISYGMGQLMINLMR